jgi:methionyl-tRNA synthetase
MLGVGLDFSELMLGAARERFAGDKRTELVEHDLSESLPDLGRFDAVVSSFAIHHLEHSRKRSLYGEVFDLLEPGGVFANFEHVASATHRLHLAFFAAIGEPIENEDPSDRLLDARGSSAGCARSASPTSIATGSGWRWRSSSASGQPGMVSHVATVPTGMSPESFFVTTPIYYVNAEPHLGHAYSTMAADVLARHMRQRGADVFFLTGTDEHGEPIETAAEREGVTPQELADRNTARFEELMPIIDASNDFFIRTSDPRHGERVAEIMQRVYDNGWVTKGTYEGWYCPRCADFKTERELGPGQTCPIHEIPLEREREENWFFRLSAFQGQLEALYEERPDFVVPDFRRNEAVSFIEGGLEDVSLSRPKLKWGMRLPWDPEQRMYVWFDALLNYVTALGFAREGEDLTERYWPADLHVLGKDILKFHAVIWPALLWAADLEPPRRMSIHGYLLMGEKKMSKSLGNVLDPLEVIERFGADALRFYCFREVSFGQDGSISTAGFEARYETELANDFGNLASRVLAMVDRYRDGVVPEAQVDAVLQEDFEGAGERFADLLDRAELSQALEEAWKLVRRLNRYVEETRPWELAKDEADPERLDEVLYNLVEGLRATTLLLVPYLPRTAEQLLAALGEDSRELTKLGARPGGQRVERVPPLFPKIETEAFSGP